MKKEVEVEIPTPPNFIRSKDGHAAISVKDFTKSELTQIGALWTAALIKKAGKKL